MLNKLKDDIGSEINAYLKYIDKKYSFNNISPQIFRYIKGLLLQKGKRLRPSLFIIGYSGFTKKKPSGLYRSSISMELLHNFILVHDDIIDKSGTRRGKLSMHNLINKHLSKYKNLRFTGEDLSIILGDIIYALGISAFLSINENRTRKELALNKLIDAAIYTGTGEFLELLFATKDIKAIDNNDIYKIYDLKTGIYSFSTPLVIGAMLAGAKKTDINRLFNCGIYLGRAFQIKDDISDLIINERGSGYEDSSDLREAKKTILVWYAYKNTDKSGKTIIRKLFKKDKVSGTDILKLRKIIIDSGSIDYAKNRIDYFVNKGITLLNSSSMRQKYKDLVLRLSDLYILNKQ